MLRKLIINKFVPSKELKFNDIYTKLLKISEESRICYGVGMADEIIMVEKPSVERLLAGGTYVLVFGLLSGAIGWIFIAIASQAGIGIGGDLLGFYMTTSAFNVIGICISGGFHQSLSKYISEALVESKEKAIQYAKAGFVIFTIIGILLFAVFITFSLIMFPQNLEYGIVFAVLAMSYYLGFLNDFQVGNLAAVHRFDLISKAKFFGIVITTGISYGILLLKYIFTDNLIVARLLPTTFFIIYAIQILFLYRAFKRVMPYSFSSILRGARRADIAPIFKYGLFCIVPNLIFSGAILWIQTLWYSGFFSFGTILVTANGLILGYAGVIFAVCQFGWPQIPAVAEAKAMKDYQLIDDYVQNTLRTGFNITALFLIIYVGLSQQILLLFHGSEYLIAHIPFILISIAVAVLGVEFLICTLLIGLGEGKKAVGLIASLAIPQIVFVPIAITTLNTLFGQDWTLYAGPGMLLLTGIALFPLAYHYLKKFSNNPPATYTNIFWKNIVSIALTFVVYYPLESIIFSQFQGSPFFIIIGFFVRVIILFFAFTFFMLFFAGYSDDDLDLYEKAIGSAKRILKPFRWVLHHSPFYNKEEVK